MRQYYSALKKNTLLSGFSEENLPVILEYLEAHARHFVKHDIIRQAETQTMEIGVVVRGLAYVTKNDYKGNRVIMQELQTGQSFGESLVFTDSANNPISIVAARDSTIVFIPARKIILSCGTSNRMCSQIVQNMIKLLAEKTMLLQIKTDILSQKTTREKLLLYFEYESKTANSKAFRIRFSREELADFLSLNASAMSRELGKMRDDGILTFKKNKFVLK